MEHLIGRRIKVTTPTNKVFCGECIYIAEKVHVGFKFDNGQETAFNTDDGIKVELESVDLPKGIKTTELPSEAAAVEGLPEDTHCRICGDKTDKSTVHIHMSNALKQQKSEGILTEEELKGYETSEAFLDEHRATLDDVSVDAVIVNKIIASHRNLLSANAELMTDSTRFMQALTDVWEVDTSDWEQCVRTQYSIIAKALGRPDHE